MFSVETALIKSTLLEFLKKNKCQQLGLDLLIKNKCERKNQINWQEGKSVICKMPLKIKARYHNMPNPKISYSDFFIGFEYKFFRNIYLYEEI